MNPVFREDVELNDIGPFKKNYWVFLALRKEQASQWRAEAKFWAGIKKLLLCGTGCQIPSSAISADGGVKMPHMNGIIIHYAAKIGAHCTIFQQVTVGIDDVDEGVPAIGEGVLIGAGAKVLGAVTVGDYARIGANAVVTRDVPAYATVIGANLIAGHHGPVCSDASPVDKSVRWEAMS